MSYIQKIEAAKWNQQADKKPAEVKLKKWVEQELGSSVLPRYSADNIFDFLKDNSKKLAVMLTKLTEGDK